MPDSALVHEVYNRPPKVPPGGAIHISCAEQEKTGAGKGIRTLDPNLGKVVLYP